MAVTDHAREKFRGAVYGMACGRKSIQERLHWAFFRHLMHLRAEQELPPHLRAEYHRILDEANRAVPTGDEGTLRATLYAMSDDQACQLARAIVNLHFALEHEEMVGPEPYPNPGSRLSVVEPE